MKLNNKGFEIPIMILIILVFMTCLILISGLINKNFKQFTNQFDYTSLENKINEASKKYIEQNKITIMDSYIVTVKELQNKGLLDNISDNTSECTGYSVVEKKSNKTTYNAYIKCGNNYETKNYANNLIE